MTLKDYMETKKKKVGNLPPDYGEQMAKKSIDKAFGDDFIKSIIQREKQQSIQINNTDELFNTITIEEATDDYYRAYKDYRRD